MRPLKYLLLSPLCVGALAWAGFILLQYGNSIIIAHSFLDNHSLSLRLTRYAVILCFVAAWPWLLRTMGLYRNWDTAVIQALVKKQWWILGFFITMEALCWHSF